MKSSRLRLGVTLLTALWMSATVGSAPAGHHRLPSFVRFSLAGKDIRGRYDGTTKYDAKAGYYLRCTIDGEGCSSSDLILTPSFKGVGYGNDDHEYLTYLDIKSVTLPRLRTGKGVDIGESPQQVRYKLGSLPTHVFYGSIFYGSSCKERIWIYEANISPQATYSAEYYFRNERLWAIQYHIQTGDDCE